jgi:hypothetical protein
MATGGEEPGHGGAGDQRVERERRVVEALDRPRDEIGRDDQDGDRRRPDPPEVNVARQRRAKRAGIEQPTRSCQHLDAEEAREDAAQHRRGPVGVHVLSADRPPELDQPPSLPGGQERRVDRAR